MKPLDVVTGCEKRGWNMFRLVNGNCVVRKIEFVGPDCIVFTGPTKLPCEKTFTQFEEEGWALGNPALMN